MLSDYMIALISVFVSIVSVVVSVLLVIYQINKNATEQLKSSFAQKRPIIIASVYPNMDLNATKKRRANFTRYVAKTKTYIHLLEGSSTDTDGKYTFFRIRNESDYHSYAVKIRINIKNNSTGAQFTDEYSFNMIASSCEYMLLVPEEYTNNNYIDEYSVEITYLSISGETMNYTCQYSNDTQKVLNRYEGTYAVRGRKKLKTFGLETYSDITETIEVR